MCGMASSDSADFTYFLLEIMLSSSGLIELLCFAHFLAPGDRRTDTIISEVSQKDACVRIGESAKANAYLGVGDFFTFGFQMKSCH
jgi:hypothetical protein